MYTESDVGYVLGFQIIILSIATAIMMLLVFPIHEINFILKILIMSQLMFMALMTVLRYVCCFFNKEEVITKQKLSKPIMFKYFNNLVHRNEPTIKRNKKSFFPFY